MDLISIIDNMSWPLFLILWFCGIVLSLALIFYGIHCTIRDGTMEQLKNAIQELKDVGKKEIDKLIGE